MRISGLAAALAALLMTGLAATPAGANCHPKFEATEAKLRAIAKDIPVRPQLMNMTAKAKKFKDDKKKKKMCEKILIRVNNLIKKVEELDGKEGFVGCAALIGKADYDLLLITRRHPNHASWTSKIHEAKGYNAEGKYKKCQKLMKKTTRTLNKYLYK